jgi:hypothetical protein
MVDLPVLPEAGVDGVEVVLDVEDEVVALGVDKRRRERVDRLRFNHFFDQATSADHPRFAHLFHPCVTRPAQVFTGRYRSSVAS